MILNRAERMLARRYLLPGKGEGFIFLVASISLIAVALGVAALIIVMSVMNGFRAELFDKIVGLNGHAVIQGYDGRLSDWQRLPTRRSKTPGVTSALPLIEQPLMATANGRVEGVLVRGMRVEDIRSQPDDQLATSSPATSSSIAPGSNTRRDRLAARRDARRSIRGGQITLWNPEGRSTVVGTVPRDRHLHRRRDLRDRRLRLRQGVRHHADAGRAELAADGRPGRHGRDPDDRSRPVEEIVAPLRQLGRRARR